MEYAIISTGCKKCAIIAPIILRPSNKVVATCHMSICSSSVTSYLKRAQQYPILTAGVIVAQSIQQSYISRPNCGKKKKKNCLAQFDFYAP